MATRDKGVIIFHWVNSPKVNVIAWLELKFPDFEDAVQQVIQNAPTTHPTILSVNMTK